MNNADYWARRLKIMEDALKDQSYEYVKNLEQQFDAAIAQIDAQMRAWYQRFADNNGGISYAEAQKLLTAGELKEFKWTVQQYIKAGKEHAISGAWAKELENASARVHISRLESLKIQLRQQAEALTQARVKATTDASELSYTQSYYHTAFEVQRGLGVGWTMQALNSGTVQKVLSRPWTVDNQTFTARCWTDKTKLVETVNQELTRMLATGEAPDKAIAAISKRFNVSKQNAGRVVMTESAYFSSAAQKDCFNELGVEKYRIISTLDTKTCNICGDMDGKVFKMSDYRPGSTAPPFHPWCRCCTAPYFDDMDGVGERYARDAKTGKRKMLPKDTTYNEWKAMRDAKTGERYKLPKDTAYNEWKAMQDAAYGSGTVDRLRKIGYNESVDKSQFERYKEWLGSNAPKTFEAFQKLKYSDDWQLFKAYTRAIKSGELTPLADFKLYKETSTSINNALVGKITNNGIIITGKSDHFIARTIGSVEQRRNGVSVAEALDTITHPERVDSIRINENGKSQRFIGKTAAVTINPDTGTLIQSNPIHKSKKAKEVTP